MNKKTLLCLGFGYTAHAFAVPFTRKGWHVRGTTRQSDKMKEIRENGVTPILWNEKLAPNEPEDASAILISTPPDETGCPALNAISNALANAHTKPTWIGYLSTNGVYGNHDGAWVTEQSALRGSSTRALARISAENAWQDFARAHDLPLTIFRLPGIYGPGRSAIETVRAGKAKRIYKKDQVFSRMHVDDIAQALTASLQHPRKFDVYNLADDEPAPPQDVIEYACQLLGVTPPPLVNIDDADLSAMARSFYADNKRVSNKKMKKSLSVTLRYPTYRDGLKAIAEKTGA